MTLVETPNNPAPEGGVVRWLEGRDGLALRTAYWQQDNAPRGTIFVMPGKAEYIEKYFEVIGELLSRGYHVVAIDWRGQGLSGREIDHMIKAYINDFNDFVSDFGIIFDTYKTILPGPYTALAHSMGGNILLRALGEHRVSLAAAVTTAPMTGLRMPAFWEKTAEAVAQQAVGFGAGQYYIPGAANYDPLIEDFDNNTVTSDKRRHSRTAGIVRACPHIAQGGATYGWIHEAFNSIRVVTDPGFGRGIDLPLLIFGAGQDKLVDPVSNRYVGTNIHKAEFHMMEEAMHEILMETDDIRAAFWQAFDEFMNRVQPANP